MHSSFSISYLLPNYKKAKCKSSARKGDNPLWNEQFLIVGVNFLEIKRQALEICFLNNQKKKNKFFGGLRLSLGYSKIMAAQAEKASKVISQLFVKPLRRDGDENASKDNTNKDCEFTTLARFAIAVEKKENSSLHLAQVNGSGPSKDSGEEESVPPKTPSVNPNVDIKETWNLTSTEELRRLECSFSDTHTNAASEKEVSTRGNDVARNSSSSRSDGEESSKGSVDTAENSLMGCPGFRETSIDGEPWTKQDQASSCESTDKNSRKISDTLESSTTVQRNDGEMGNGKCNKNNGLDANGNKPVHQTNGNLNKTTNKVSEKQSKLTEPEDIRNIKNENEREGSPSTSGTSDSNKASEKSESSTSCSAGFSQRWSRAGDQKREAKKTQIEKVLGDNLESVMLDAVGLEIKQWENMVNKPKQWQYCWQILRKDMIPVHHCNT